MDALKELIDPAAVAGAGLNDGRFAKIFSNEVVARIIDAVFISRHGGGEDSLPWEIMSAI